MNPSGRLHLPDLLRLLLRELRRRGVLRAASVYVVGAWVAIQAGDIILPKLGFPDNAVVAVIALALAGFPLVVVLSWIYRVGMDREAVPAEAELAGGQLRVAVGVAMLLGIAALGSAGWVALQRGDRARMSPASGPPLDRVAVLYFTDLTRDSSLAYLAPALTGALIDHLGDVEGLKVISRGGVTPYREHPVTPDSLARALGVGAVVEGEVLKVGDRVRVSVQLFEAPAGTVLTSVELDRHRAAPLALVQSVVLEVGDSLLAQLGRERRVRRWIAGTTNPEAWSLLQRAQRNSERARELLLRSDDSGALIELDAADSLLARAERLDPGYAEATVQRAQLAQHRAMVLLRSQPQAVAQVLATGEAHATRALRRRQDAAAYEQRGVLRNLRAVFAAPEDTAGAASLWAEVEADARAALALDDQRIRARTLLAQVLEGRGAFDQAALLLEEAYALDAYQENAAYTVDRLFTLNFEQAHDSAAAYWCRELRRRKGLVVQTASCALQLAAWAEARPDVRRARALADSARTADRAGADRYGDELLDVLVAAVMARAGQVDSARAMLQRVRDAQRNYPELLQLQAGVHALLREYEAAGALLREYGQLQPGGGALLAQSRRFSVLPANPLATARPL